MVGLDYIERSARRALRRLGTSMAWAMLRALGVDPSRVGRRRLPRGSVASVAARDELAECFANRESPMDGRGGA